jgi:hypothetical protein
MSHHPYRSQVKADNLHLVSFGGSDCHWQPGSGIIETVPAATNRLRLGGHPAPH